MFTTEVIRNRDRQYMDWFFSNRNEAWPGFVEILKLEDKLAGAGIPYEKRVKFGGWLIAMNDNDGRYIGDAVEHCGSYGRDEDLIEIMGFDIDPEEVGDSVIGYLNANEVFEYFKRAFEKISETK